MRKKYPDYYVEEFNDPTYTVIFYLQILFSIEKSLPFKFSAFKVRQDR